MASSDSSGANFRLAPSLTETAILEIAERLTSELHQENESNYALGLDSRLDRDLGLDSLSQLELIHRVEQSSGIAGSHCMTGRAETLRDILQIFTENVVGTSLINFPSGRLERSRNKSRKNSPVQATNSAFALDALFYTVYVRLLFGLAVPFLWLSVILLPGLGRRRRLAWYFARLLLRLARIQLNVVGAQCLKKICGQRRKANSSPNAKQEPVVIVANHASYLDGIVLTAALPPEFAFVVKRELGTSLLKRAFLRRLGALFVERFDLAQAMREPIKLLDAVMRGESIVMFPEGTFRGSPGLLSFRMGAFVVATQSGAPIVPVVIRGTREILRGDDVLLRRGGIRVTILPPYFPKGSSWPAAVALRDAVRAEILRQGGEPDGVNKGLDMRSCT